MLSAPVKSARRISSFFSSSSNNDDTTSVASKRQSPQRPHSSRLVRASPDRASNGHFYNSSRNASQSSLRGRSPHDPHIRNPLPPEGRFDLNSPLPPPPSLMDVNQDLAQDLAKPVRASSPDGDPRRHSRSASRPSSSGSLSMSEPRRSRTPTSHVNKRKSWMPGMQLRPESIIEQRPPVPSAWVAGLDQRVPYDLEPLSRGEQVCGKDFGDVLSGQLIPSCC